MRVAGTGSVARRNRIRSTGGTTVSTWAIGIDLQNGASALDNTIDGVAARAGGNGNAYGLYVDMGGASGVVARNRIRGVARDGAGGSFGVHAGGYNRLVLRDNVLVASAAGGTALACDLAAGTRARGNTLSGWTTPYVNCVAASANVVRP
jgi:hypothetical protein